VKKTFILDTNVLLHDPDSIFSFQDNEVVIPFAVIEEIDAQKKRQDEFGRNAREVCRKLDAFRENGRLSEGVILPNGCKLWIELNHYGPVDLPPGFEPRKHDNRILAVARGIMREGKTTVIVTKDLNLRVKADVLGLMAEDFRDDQIDYQRLYRGVEHVQVEPQDLATFYREGRLELNCKITGLPNQFFILTSAQNPSQSALARCLEGRLVPLRFSDQECCGIRARNKEQKFALDLLLDDNVQVVTLLGRAGTGKTLLALAAGLQKVMEEGLYCRLLVTRPVIPVGEDLGYLPGNKEEKLRPWMQPIYDNLEFLVRDSDEPFKVIDHLLQRGLLEMESLTYIRGRSIPKQFIVCDEAQNLTPHMIKSLITRVGEGSKIVFTGDAEQIDHPYLDAGSNGLTYLVEKLKAEDLAGHVTLVKGERSRVAEMGARLL